PVINASATLAAIGPASIKPLLAVLNDPNRSVSARAGAAGALGAIGPRAASAVPGLIEALKDRRETTSPPANYPQICVTAIWALGSMGLEAKVAVPALAELLRVPSPSVRQAVAEALTEFGPDAAA